MNNFDTAQELEIMHREHTLAQHERRRPKEPEQEFDEQGNAVCIDCGSQIATERLAAKPNAARCVECQAIQEERR